MKRFSILLLFVAGCVLPNGFPPAPPENFGDAGAENRECPPGDAGLECNLALAEDFATACGLLVEKTCEIDGSFACPDAAGCVAAQVLGEFAPDRCFDALENPSFPACRASSCETLVQRVCGSVEPPGACEDGLGCSPAREFLKRADGAVEDERLSAERSCGRALEDAVFFPDC